MSSPPPEGSLERWAWDYLYADSLAHKLAPPPAPAAVEERPTPRRVTDPTRPGLTVQARADASPSAGGLRNPAERARLFHTFIHHELQAAELMAWAILAFPEAPPAFRRGLVTVCEDEIRHMALYAEHMAALGHPFGAWPVRDWFWQRVPAATTPAHFVATMSMGFEAANLDHCARFAARLRSAGDPEAARRVEQVGEEELPHVRFGLHWFKRFTGGDGFAGWAAHLPPPLSPWLMKGPALDRPARRRAGLGESFLDALEGFAFVP